MKYRVLGGVYSEGWQPGDLIDLDENAAHIRVEKGEMELYVEGSVWPKPKAKAEDEAKPATDAVPAGKRAAPKPAEPEAKPEPETGTEPKAAPGEVKPKPEAETKLKAPPAAKKK